MRAGGTTPSRRALHRQRGLHRSGGAQRVTQCRFGCIHRRRMATEALRMARASARSPKMVPAAWALMWSMSAGVRANDHRHRTDYSLGWAPCAWVGSVSPDCQHPRSEKGHAFETNRKGHQLRLGAKPLVSITPGDTRFENLQRTNGLINSCLSVLKLRAHFSSEMSGRCLNPMSHMTRK